MDYRQPADFPFTIMDAASLLRLNIRRKGAGHVYVDCPICGDRRGRMTINTEQRTQRFRVYQLDLEGAKTYPFAFRSIKEMRKAGYQQPPAADYRLIYDGAIPCAKTAEVPDVLELIYIRCNNTFPEGYVGHSLSMSDVVELYDEEKRSYFYRDTTGFTPVQFAAAQARPLPGKDSGAKGQSGAT